MLALLGEFTDSGNGLEKYLLRRNIGRMWSRDPVKLAWPGESFGFDNGAYTSWSTGKPWDDSRFMRRLDYAHSTFDRKNCAVAVCPDIVAEGERSLDFSLKWIDILPAWPWFLAVQDGMTQALVQPHLPRFAGVFLGGTSDFKLTANAWCSFAHENGKAFHYGRCSSIARVRDAIAIGADSIDSTRPVRAWVSGERDRAKQWFNVAMGRDNQQHFL